MYPQTLDHILERVSSPPLSMKFNPLILRLQPKYHNPRHYRQRVVKQRKVQKNDNVFNAIITAWPLLYSGLSEERYLPLLTISQWGEYTNDPIIPPKDPTELCSAMPTARFVGDPRILFEFQAIVIAMPGNAPIAARNVPAYLAPVLSVTYKTTNPIAATK